MERESSWVEGIIGKLDGSGNGWPHSEPLPGSTQQHRGRERKGRAGDLRWFELWPAADGLQARGVRTVTKAVEKQKKEDLNGSQRGTRNPSFDPTQISPV